MPHPDTCPAHATTTERLDSLHVKLDLIIGAVCGDLAAKEPGLAERVRNLEARCGGTDTTTPGIAERVRNLETRFRVLLILLLATGSGLLSLGGFLGLAKLVAALKAILC